MGGNGCIFVQNITKEGFQRKPLLFFLFFVLYFIDFLKFLMVFTIFLQENLKTLGGIHEMRKIKNIETHLVPRLGPRAGAEAGAERWKIPCSSSKSRIKGQPY